MTRLEIGEMSGIRVLGMVGHMVEEAERLATGPINPDFERFIDEPAHAADLIRGSLLRGLRDTGRMWPTVCMTSRYGQQFIFFDAPPRYASAARMAAGLQLLVALTPIESIWFACESWMADVDRRVHGPDIEALAPSQREDKREGLVIAAATRHRHEVWLHEIMREAASVDLGPRVIGGELVNANPLLRSPFNGVIPPAQLVTALANT